MFFVEKELYLLSFNRDWPNQTMGTCQRGEKVMQRIHNPHRKPSPEDLLAACCRNLVLSSPFCCLCFENNCCYQKSISVFVISESNYIWIMWVTWSWFDGLGTWTGNHWMVKEYVLWHNRFVGFELSSGHLCFVK